MNFLRMDFYLLLLHATLLPCEHTKKMSTLYTLEITLKNKSIIIVHFCMDSYDQFHRALKAWSWNRQLDLSLNLSLVNPTP